MRAAPRPKSITVCNETNARSVHHPRPPRLAPVTSLLPLSAALLLTLAVPSPAAARTSDESGLHTLRVELASARAEVADLREHAGEMITRYEREAELLEEATEAREAAVSRADTATRLHRERRLEAARQAAGAYKGEDLSPARAWTGPEGPVGLLERGAYLALLGEHRSAALDRAEASRVATATLAGSAEKAEEERSEATEAAARAREEAEEAIAEQEEKARELLKRQTALEEAITDAGRPSSADGSHARAAGDGSSEENDAPASDATSSAGGVCEGRDPGDFGNGRVPDSALCPLPQPGEVLRADAAEAFVELDGAYREEFGRPMCVTDSYRPYHEQVRLFQEMLPGMAARPGTSAHGLGVAVDLCGRVDVLDSAEHRWMLDHAPEYGWENPDWARDGFEPWHWEYTP